MRQANFLSRRNAVAGHNASIRQPQTGKTSRRRIKQTARLLIANGHQVLWGHIA
jgi:hypothetical protein